MSTTKSLTCFSLNGFMGNMWLGPQAEVAKRLSDLGLAYFQPIGYDSSRFPLSIGVNAARGEFRRQRTLHPGPYLASSWSEGTIAFMLELQAEIAAGNHDCKGGVTYGNPYRAAGQWNPCPPALGSVGDPGGAGIGGPRNNWKTPASIHHYCHGPHQPSYDGLPGIDQYTCCSTGEDGNIARIIFDFVLTQWSGAFADLVAFIEAFATSPPMTLIAIVETAVEWIRFFGGQTRPHTNYTSYAGAAYLAGVAHTLP